MSVILVTDSRALSRYDVIINELAWMGSGNSANDEWIELYNNTGQSIDLSGWVLKSVDEKLKINLKGVINARGFYLLERTDNSSVPDTAADLIYKGALLNSGADLKLIDNLGNMVDGLNYSSGWPAGNNETKQTMERVGSLWQTSKEPNGTAKSANSSGVPTVTKADKNKAEELPKKEKADKNAAVASLQDSVNPLEEKSFIVKQTEKENNYTNPWFLFIIALSITVISAIIILFVKLKLKQKQ